MMTDQAMHGFDRPKCSGSPAASADAQWVGADVRPVWTHRDTADPVPERHQVVLRQVAEVPGTPRFQRIGTICDSGKGAARFGRRTMGPHAHPAAPSPLSHEGSRHEAAMAKKSRADRAVSRAPSTAWKPDVSDIDWFMELRELLRRPIERNWPGRWERAVEAAADQASISLLVAMSAAMNGSAGAWLDTIEFCNRYRLPLPPVLTDKVGLSISARFGGRREQYLGADKRIALPFDRIRFEHIQWIMGNWTDINRFIEDEKLIIDQVEHPEYVGDNVKQLERYIAFYRDTNNSQSLDGQIKLALAIKLFVRWKGNMPIWQPDGRAGDFALSKLVESRLLGAVTEDAITRAYRGVEVDQETMIRLPPEKSDLEGLDVRIGYHFEPERGRYLEWCRSLTHAGLLPPIWPGRHYIPSDKALHQLGAGDLIRAVRNAEIESDAPVLRKPG